MAVNLLHNAYEKSLLENEKNIQYVENHLQKLDALNFNIFSEKLAVPLLVPIGSRILYRGELKHTNEVTVALGADYFTKCSINQAEVLKQHRIKDTKSKLELLKREKEFLHHQLSFSKQIVSDGTSCDIIEVVTEEEDKAWRLQHRENMRQYKQRELKDGRLLSSEISDKELWDRLEELELQEEIENELETDKINEENPNIQQHAHANEHFNERIVYEGVIEVEPYDGRFHNEVYVVDPNNRTKMFQQPSKLHLFELVVERHKALKKMVEQIQTSQRNYKSEDEMLARLDETERLEQLEDEIAILEDMLASDEEDDIEQASEEEDSNNQQKKSVVFADEDDSNTFDITFKHSEVEPCKDPYDPQKGIIKPSDLSVAFSNCFIGETPSILKKSKSDSPSTEVSKITPITGEIEEEKQDESNIKANSVVVNDVVERLVWDDNNDNNHNERPMSLFKQRRQQRKE